MTAGLGINIGHGFAKVVLLVDDHEPQQVTLPALVAHAQAQMDGALTTIRNTEFDGKHWWTGQDALLGTNHRTALNQDRMNDPVFIPVLTKAALERLQGNGIAVEDRLARTVWVSGLPATWANDQALGKALSARIKAGVGGKLGKGKIIPEPLGLLYAAALNDRGEIVDNDLFRAGRIAVVDLGHATVDVAEMNNLMPVPESLTTFQLGTAYPLGTIRKRIGAAFQQERSLYEVDQAVRARKIKVRGQLMDLPGGWEQDLASNGRTIAAKLVETWNAGTQFDSILIGGGGAELPWLVAPIAEAFPHAQVVPNGQMAIALGYARLARHLAGAS